MSFESIAKNMSLLLGDEVADRVNCRLYVHGDDGVIQNYNVYSFKGESWVMGMYLYDVVFVSDVPLEINRLNDMKISVVLQDEINPLKMRNVCGYASYVMEYGAVSRKYLYHLNLVSPLHYLAQTKRYEIYQDKSVLEIVSLIVGRYSALLDMNLLLKADSTSYSQRHYCTQYEQSDYEFIRMLLEEEGLVLLCDSSSLNFTISVCHLSDHAVVVKDVLSHINHAKSFKLEHSAGFGYDREYPSNKLRGLKNNANNKKILLDNTHTLKLQIDLLQETWYDRLDPYDSSLSKETARYTTLNANRQYAKSIRVYGESNDIEVFEGQCYELNDVKLFKKEKVIVLSCTYNGIFPNALEELIEDGQPQQTQYSVSFESIPYDVAYYPHLSVEKPRIHSVQTAIVSKGRNSTPNDANEIDVNEYGEIRVLMHFDKKYPTSCYMPLNTMWAGDNYGMRFLPRVNSEVIVGFLNGDIDRPVILGSLHNGENQIPYPLPYTKTQSYIKTQTTPQYGGSEGYNEILFEDKPNGEELNLRAQKDYNLLVLNDSTEIIKHDKTKIIDNNEDITVKGFLSESVHQAKTETIFLAKALSIGAGYQVSVGASKNESVGVSSTEEVGVVRYFIAGEKYELSVGESKLSLQADGSVFLGGKNINITGVDHIEVIGGKVYIDKGAWTPAPLCIECMMRAMKGH